MEIPTDQVQIFLSRVESIRAHEALYHIRDLQLGGGFMKQEDSRPVMRELEQQQKALFVGSDVMEKKKEAMLNNLLATGLPIGHLLPPNMNM